LGELKGKAWRVGLNGVFFPEGKYHTITGSFKKSSLVLSKRKRTGCVKSGSFSYCSFAKIIE